MEQTQNSKPLAAGAAMRANQRDFERELHLNRLRQDKIMLERRIADIDRQIEQLEDANANGNN
jgi:hypothetical protein